MSSDPAQVVARLPSPLAHAYSRMLRANDPVAEFVHALETVEETVRYLALVSLARYLETRARQPDLELERRVQGLRRPALGHWVDVLRRLETTLAGLEQPTHHLDEQLLDPRALELCRKFVSVVGTRHRFTLLHLLDAFTTLRNRTKGHGTVSPAIAEQYKGSTEAALAHLIQRVTTLSVPPPVVIRGIRHRAQRFAVEYFPLLGTGSPLPMNRSLDHFGALSEARVFLWDGVGTPLPLSPLMHYAGDAGRDDGALKLFAGIEANVPIYTSPQLPGDRTRGENLLAAFSERAAFLLISASQEPGASVENPIGAYRSQVETAMRDARITTDEWSMLVTLRGSLGLSHGDVEAVHAEFGVRFDDGPPPGSPLQSAERDGALAGGPAMPSRHGPSDAARDRDLAEPRAGGTDRAELHLVTGPDYTDRAIEQHMRVLKADPYKYESYKALRRIYMDARQYDKAWCVCNALAFLESADAAALAFYEKYKPPNLVKTKNVMTPDTWAKLRPSDENRDISAIFEASWDGVAAMKASSHTVLGIRREDKLQLPGDSMVGRRLHYVAQVLNVPPPEVFIRYDREQVDIKLANAIENTELCPSFFVRPHMLQGKGEREVTFLAARRLTFMRPEYYLKMLLPTNSELEVVVRSAIAMVQPRFPIPPDMVQDVQQYIPEMQNRMPPQRLKQLAAVVSRFIQVAPATNEAPEMNLAKWGHAVDAVSHRTGFLVCGDLQVAARMVSAEPVVVDGPKKDDKIMALVLYSISEEFFTVRAQMGMTIAG